MKCPKCGSENCHFVDSSRTSGYSAANGCCGFLLLGGPIGLLCGLCGSGDTVENKYWVCNACGANFQAGDRLSKQAQAVVAQERITLATQTFCSAEFLCDCNTLQTVTSEPTLCALLQEAKYEIEKLVESSTPYLKQRILYTGKDPQNLCRLNGISLMCTMETKSFKASEIVIMAIDTSPNCNGLSGWILSSKNLYFACTLDGKQIYSAISIDEIYSIEIRMGDVWVNELKVNCSSIISEDLIPLAHCIRKILIKPIEPISSGTGVGNMLISNGGRACETDTAILFLVPDSNNLKIVNKLNHEKIKNVSNPGIDQMFYYENRMYCLYSSKDKKDSTVLESSINCLTDFICVLDDLPNNIKKLCIHEDKVYFLTKRGALFCYDINTKEKQQVLPEKSCHAFAIFDNKLFYTSFQSITNIAKSNCSYIYIISMQGEKSQYFLGNNFKEVIDDILIVETGVFIQCTPSLYYKPFSDQNAPALQIANNLSSFNVIVRILGLKPSPSRRNL